MQITLNPTTAAMLADRADRAAATTEDDAFDLLSPSPFLSLLDLDFDPFAPTCTADLDAMGTAENAANADAADLDALNEEGDSLFDLLDYDPFAKFGAEDESDESDESDDLGTDAANDAACRACCPYHGPHEVDEDGNALDYCERCEGSL